MEKRLFTVREAAVYLGMSEQTIRNGICKGKKASNKRFPVEPIRIGIKPYFDVKELDAYVELLKDARNEKMSEM